MNIALIERFCSRCGVSLVPLEVPHTSRACSDCGKSKHFVKPGANGQGIQIEAGDTFSIPSDWITLSLDPAVSRGRLARGGVQMLLQQLILNVLPKDPGEFVDAVTKQRDVNEVELLKSDRLAGLDISTEKGANAMFTRLSEEKGCPEWYLMLKDGSAANTIDAIGENNAEKAAYAGLQMGLFHAMCFLSQPQVEETIWRGYLANLAIYEAEFAADHVPGEVSALATLDPLFQQIGEATLQTWVDANVPIGPRISVKAIPESLLLARAKWHLDNFKRTREAEVRKPAESRAKSELRIKWLTLLGTIVGSGVIGSLISRIF